MYYIMLHVCYGWIINFDILWLNPSNFTFKMTNFLIGKKKKYWKGRWRLHCTCLEGEWKHPCHAGTAPSGVGPAHQGLSLTLPLARVDYAVAFFFFFSFFLVFSLSSIFFLWHFYLLSIFYFYFYYIKNLFIPNNF